MTQIATRRLGRTEHQSSLAILGGAAFWNSTPAVTEQMFQLALQAGVNHLGGADGLQVDSSREFMPCGQGVGAINTLESAGDIVRGMVAEAERVMEQIASVRR